MEGLKISEGLRMPTRQATTAYGLIGQLDTIRHSSLAALAARNEAAITQPGLAALAAGIQPALSSSDWQRGCPEEAFLYTMRSVTPKKD